MIDFILTKIGDGTTGTNLLWLSLFIFVACIMAGVIFCVAYMTWCNLRLIYFAAVDTAKRAARKKRERLIASGHGESVKFIEYIFGINKNDEEHSDDSVDVVEQDGADGVRIVDKRRR